jgi:hypothetical protein
MSAIIILKGARDMLFSIFDVFNCEERMTTSKLLAMYARECMYWLPSIEVLMKWSFGFTFFLYCLGIHLANFCAYVS